MRMRLAVLLGCVLALPMCQVTCPLGEGGCYGTVYAGYRLPENFGDILLNQPTLGDK